MRLSDEIRVFTWRRFGQSAGIVSGLVLMGSILAAFALMDDPGIWIAISPLLAIIPCSVLAISSAGNRRLALKGLAITLGDCAVCYGIALGARFVYQVDYEGRGLPMGLILLVVVALWAWPVGVIVAMVAGLKSLVASFRGQPGFCQECGYDLTGNMSGVCPECGQPTSGSMRSTQSPLPVRYRLSRFVLLSLCVASTCLIMGAIFIRHDHVHYRLYLSRQMGDFGLLLALAGMVATLGFLLFSRRARKDVLVWACLLIGPLGFLGLDVLSRARE